METTEQIKAMDGQTGSETGMLLFGTFYTDSQWAEAVEEIESTTTKISAAKMIKKAKPAKCVWVWKVQYSFPMQAYVAVKTDEEIFEI